MNRAAWHGMLALSILLGACVSHKTVQVGVGDHAETSRYPSIFLKPPRGLAGIGFSPLGLYTSDSSYVRAAEMAYRQFAWSSRVRVKGERLFEQVLGGGLAFRGEQIELLDVPATGPESCRLETLAVDRQAWIVALPADRDGGVPKGVDELGRDLPSWVLETPRVAGWFYALGSAVNSFKDEPGSWELATYNALVELAISVGARSEALEQSTLTVVSEASRLVFDSELRGFEVAARWRDQDHVYVLGRAPVDRSVSLLAVGD